MKKPSFKYFLKEVHYKDQYPKSFHQFYEKWKSKKDSEFLYVNFSNHGNNTLDKNFNLNPDHSDMAGLYCYPLKYVIEHPSDIWYGSNAKYLRVIETEHKGKILFLQHLSDANIYSMLNTLGYTNIDNAFKYIRRRTGLKNKNQLFFKLFQITNIDDYMNGADAEIKTAQQQTQDLIKLGYSSVIDDSRNQKKCGDKFKRTFANSVP